MNQLLYAFRASSKLPPFINKILFGILNNLLFFKNAENPEAIQYLRSVRPDLGESSFGNNTINNSLNYDLQIIVPVYNVESFLEECLDSIFNQKTKYKYFVVAVNDGSSDNSAEILKKYSNYPNLKIITQQNKGLSGARNSALKEINAEYVMFVDSDDVLFDGALDTMLDCAKSSDAEIVQGGYSYYYDDGTLRDGPCMKDGFCDAQKLPGFAWGKLYKSYLWKNYQFPERYLFEDTINKIIMFNFVKKAYVSSAKVLKYRCNQSGITATSKKNYKSVDTVWVTKRLIEDYKNMNMPITETVCAVFLKQFMFNYSRLLELNDKVVCIAAFLLYRQIFETIDVDMSKASFGIKTAYKSLKEGNYKTFLLCSLFLRGC